MSRGAILAALTLAGACERVTGPIEVSYLAIVTLVDALPGVSPGATYGYRVRELSGTLGVDTTIVAAPQDTVILRVPAATYSVTLTGLPTACTSRHGLEQYTVVLEGAYTSLARYYVSCLPGLTVHLYTEGTAPDSSLVYRLSGTDGTERLGLAGGNDTLRFDGLTPGPYEFGLSLLAAHCVVTSDGGARPRIPVSPGGGAVLDMRIACSDEAHRPHLVHFAATYRDGVSALVFSAADPDHDIERYFWDLTDCRGTSVVPGGGGGRLRRGLTSGRTRGLDTILVVTAFEVGRPDSEMAGACTALRVIDEQGNTTPVVELPIGAAAGAPPAPTAFNAYLVDTLAVRTQLAAADADGDFVGTFVTARLRDGVLSAPDGQPDIGIYGVAGYLGEAIPDLPLGTRIHYGDVYAVIVYLIDRGGNVTRIEDVDVFR